MRSKRVLVSVLLFFLSESLLCQTSSVPLKLLKPGDVVQRNGDTYTIENNEYQTIREFSQIGPTNGTLILYGGGDLSDEMLRIFENQIGGKDERIIAITTAACWDEILDVESSYLEYMLSFGFTNVEVLHTRDIKEANSQEFSDRLRNASGIWFGGGGPECLLAPYLHTNFHESLKNYLGNGGVIAGTSAGAIVLGSYFQALHGEPERVGRIEFEGFSFLKNVAVAAHIDTSENMFEEQIVSVINNYYPGLLGIGISEDTAIVVKKDLLSVDGAGLVKIYDGRAIKTLGRNEEYDLAGRN